MSKYEQNFWDVDMSRPDNGESGVYSYNLSAARKYCWALAVLFVVFWTFYVGFAYAASRVPDHPYVVDGAYLLNNPDPDEADPDPYVPPKQLMGTKVIMIVGTDIRNGDGGFGQSDTLILAFVDMDNNDVKLLSIPRDTYVTVPGTKTKTKINGTYTAGGITTLRNTVELLLGVRVDYYVSINFRGFISVVDAINGIYLDIDRRMENLEEDIDLYPGKNQLLNGEQALGFVRWREPLLADIGRIGRQQYFIKELSRQVLQPANIVKIPQFVDIFIRNVKTDMSFDAATEIGNVLFALDLAGLETHMVPGLADYVNGVSYWMADEKQTRTLLAHLTGEEEDALNINIPVVEKTDPSAPVIAVPPVIPPPAETPEDTQTPPDDKTPPDNAAPPSGGTQP